MRDVHRRNRRGGGHVWPWLAVSLLAVPCHAAPPETDQGEPAAAGEKLLLEDFRPEPMLKVRHHDVRRAKFPVVDVHIHPRVRRIDLPEALAQFVALMDRNHMAVGVSLDGRLGAELQEHVDLLAAHPHRFVVFANIDWQGDGQAEDYATWDMHREDFARRTVEALRQAKRLGAAGVKIFKNFGLQYRNPDGTLVRIDDPRWDPIWKACGELGLVVLIHTADPQAFFLPVDARNERWEELHRRPQWSFYGPGFPSRKELLAARNRVLARHPRTTFIGAHVANGAEDLAEVGRWLDTYPNLYVDIASRISELGRQPYTARRFFLKYADRILFATDGPWPEERLWLYWRFLETDDEYFPYSEKPFPPQGFWRIYGIFLPDEVLRKVYYQNAARVIPAVAEALRAQGIEP